MAVKMKIVSNGIGRPPGVMKTAVIHESRATMLRSTTIVPAAGGLVLGAIGLGLVGWVKRPLS